MITSRSESRAAHDKYDAWTYCGLKDNVGIISYNAWNRVAERTYLDVFKFWPCKLNQNLNHDLQVQSKVRSVIIYVKSNDLEQQLKRTRNYESTSGGFNER